MTTVSTKSGRIIKVVSREEEKSTLTESDSENGRKERLKLLRQR